MLSFVGVRRLDSFLHAGSWLQPLSLCAALLVTSCYATDAYVEARYVPARVETYPSAYHDGRTVYLVNDLWYFRDGPRWVHYRTEPEPLYRRRVYVQQAPAARPAYRYDERRVRRAPPTYYEQRRSAPAYYEDRRRGRDDYRDYRRRDTDYRPDARDRRAAPAAR